MNTLWSVLRVSFIGRQEKFNISYIDKLSHYLCDMLGLSRFERPLANNGWVVGINTGDRLGERNVFFRNIVPHQLVLCAAAISDELVHDAHLSRPYTLPQVSTFGLPAGARIELAQVLTASGVPFNSAMLVVPLMDRSIIWVFPALAYSPREPCLTLDRLRLGETWEGLVLRWENGLTGPVVPSPFSSLTLIFHRHGLI